MESKLRSTRRIKFFGLWVMTLMLATAALFVTVTTVGGSSNSAKPLGGISFKVEIPGVITGPFESISGLESETEVIEFKDDGELVSRKKPGRTTYSNITLKRGYTASDELYVWRKTIIDGDVDNNRRTGSIILIDPAGNEIERFTFFEAWPVRYKNYEIESDGKNVLIEEIEIVVEKIERGSAGGTIGN